MRSLGRSSGLVNQSNFLALLFFLKAFQRLGCFPYLFEVPIAAVDHVRAAVGWTSPTRRRPRTPAPRRGAAATSLPLTYAAVHAAYIATLSKAPIADDTRRAYASRLRQYLAWQANTDVDGDPLNAPAARDAAVRDYRTHLQTVASRAPATINTTLASLADFYTRRGLGPPDVRRLDLPQRAPRAPTARDATRWLRTVERWLNPRDRVLALLPFYAGLRIGEAIMLNLDDIAISARKGLITVRAGKGQRYRQIPPHPELRTELATWINDERPGLARRRQPAPAAQPPRRASQHSRRNRHPHRHRRILWTRRLHPDVLRHTFGTTLIRNGHDIVLVAELLGHARLETTRTYTLPTTADREHAINSLPTDR